MSEYAMEPFDDVLPEEPNGEVVHWMAPRPLTMGPTGVSMVTVGAFAVGAVAAVAVMAMMRWLPSQRSGAVDTWRRRLPF